MEHFYSTLKVLAESFNFQDCDEAIRRVIITTNMSDTQIKRHMHRQKTDRSKAHQAAINIEMGGQNQMRINNTAQLTFKNVQNNSGYCTAKRQQPDN